MDDLIEHGLVGGCRRGNDLRLLIKGWIVDVDIEHKPVELGLGQRIRPLLFDGVLRCQDKEGKVEVIGYAPGRHLVFLHCLKQRGLGLWRRPIDLVRQKNIRKNGALDKAELALLAAHLLLEDIGSRDVRRHQVGRELDPVEIKFHDASQG